MGAWRTGCMATTHLSPKGRVSRHHSETLGAYPLWLATRRTAVRIPPGKTRGEMGWPRFGGGAKGVAAALWSVCTRQVCLGKACPCVSHRPDMDTGRQQCGSALDHGRWAANRSKPTSAEGWGGSSDSKGLKRAKCLLESRAEGGTFGG